MAYCENCAADIGESTYCPKCGYNAQTGETFGQAPPPPTYPDPPPVYQDPPPQYQAPPQYQDPPPQYQTPPPQYQTPPPQYQGPPPQYQAPPPQYQAPPQYSNFGYARGPQNEGLFLAALILMIIGTIAMAIPTYGIALAWGIPMTIHVARIRKGEKPNTTGFAVCCLIFVGVIAGILLLVAPKDR